MRTTAMRIDGGARLREAMKDKGWGLHALSQATRDAGGGRGVSVALLGFLTQDAGTSRHARETTSEETAALIEDALGVPRESLFRVVEAPGRGDPQPAWDDMAAGAR